MRADTITKDFISDANVFADVFNYYIYGGKQVVSPERLRECDTVEIAVPYNGDGAAVPVQRFRDKQNLCAVMTDGELEYVLFGAEAQTQIQYAMPVKNNLYDALDYAGQVEEAAKSHRRGMGQAQKQGTGISGTGSKKPNRGEFLSGFWKEDRLIPSVTVTIYFGCEEWDGPLSLFDMMKVKDPQILSCLDNYRVHLIAPAKMPDEEIMKLRSNLREVLLFIKYSKDRKNLDRILEKNRERFCDLERRAVDVIEVITKMGLKYDEGEEKVDMCQAIAEMRAEERRLGREEERQKMCQAIAEMRAEERRLGREEERQKMCQAIAEMRVEERRLGREEERQKMCQVMAEMRAEERELGREEGQQESKQEAARGFYKMGLDTVTIARGLNVSVELIEQWIDCFPEE